jgi:hypothetical protein
MVRFFIIEYLPCPSGYAGIPEIVRQDSFRSILRLSYFFLKKNAIKTAAEFIPAYQQVQDGFSATRNQEP